MLRFAILFSTYDLAQPRVHYWFYQW